MKIADYGKAMTSYIEAPTRGQKNLSKLRAENPLRTSFAEGSDDKPIIPEKKPKQLSELFERINRSVLAVRSNTIAPEFILPELEKITQEYIGDGLISGEDARKFAIERKDYWDKWISENPKGTTPTFDFDNEGNPTEVDQEEIIKRINEADGGRIGFDEGTKKYAYSNPLRKNQFIMRTNEEIQAIIDDPKYKDYTRKDFRNEGVLTRKETERPDLKFKNFGKKIKVDKRKRADESIKKFIKGAQGSQISMDVNNNFAHFAPKLKSYLVSTANTGPLKASINRAAEGYDKAIKIIAENQEKLVLEKPKNFKKLLEIENAKAFKLAKDANANLPKDLKGTLGYFQVSEDGKFKLKGVDKSKTFAGLSGDETVFKTAMTAKERKEFGKTQSTIQKLIDENPSLKRASNVLLKGTKIAGKVIKPLGVGFGINAVKNAVSQAEDQGLELNLIDKIIAFDSGEAEIALNNAKRRVDPEFAAAERAKDLAKMTDDFEEVGQTTFGKYNDEIKNIKLP
tara:strand:+ start:733 stop:2268 length:1536 start_codon:yes stop_codon:yes gene_type:complete